MVTKKTFETNLARRHFMDRWFYRVCVGSVVFVTGILILLLASFVKKGFQALSFDFLTQTDSRVPELAGVLGGLVGSGYVLLIVLLTAVPAGVLTAIYLEEFAKRTPLTALCSIFLSNMAAVPSIIFGLTGVSFFIKLLGMPRSSPLIGGLTLGLLSIPLIVVTTKTALRTVPRSIRLGALGMGASKLQVVFHHVLPLSIPHITTGVLLSLARVLGETAPLLLLGLSAYVYEVPESILDPATTLPLLIYNWSRYPEDEFMALASAGILVLLALVGALSIIAIYIRHKFEQRW